MPESWKNCLKSFFFGCCSVTKLCLTLCDPMDYSLWRATKHQASLPHHLLEFAQVHVHWISDAIQPSHPVAPFLLLPSVFPSVIVLSRESALHVRWPKYWSFRSSISPSNEYSGLIFFFKIDWFDLLAVQGTLKSLLQYHSSKASKPKDIFFIWLLDKESFLLLKNWTFRTKSSFLAYIMFCKTQYSFFPLLINEVVSQIL